MISMVYFTVFFIVGVTISMLVRRERKTKTMVDEKEQNISLLQVIMDGAKKSSLVYLDRDFRVIRANSTFLSEFGITLNEVIGKNYWELFKETKDELFTRVRNTGVAAEWHDNPFIFPNQPERGITYWDGYLEPVKDSHGTVTGLILSSYETTNRKQYEDKILEQTAALDAVNKELETFSYSVSHDLRAPLRSLSGYSQMLLEECSESLNEQGKKYLFRIQDNTKKMESLIDAILRLSRQSRKELHIQTVNLTDVSNTITERLQQEDPARPVTIHVADKLIVEGDKELLTNAMENLIQNAWKYTKKKRNPVIEVGSTQNLEGTVYFVKDNGAGFNMAHADKLFMPFYRLHSDQEFPGIGIGLATTQRIIEKHSGRIWAEGTPGKGAVFYFTLKTRVPELNTDKNKEKKIKKKLV